MPRTPRVLPRLLAGLAVAAVVLGGVELGLRLALGPPPAPVKVFGGLDADVTLADEPDGWRAAWQTDIRTVLPRERAGGRPLVYVAGGSTVHGGSGIDARGEFSAKLGPAAGVDPRNLGAPGLDSHDLVQVVEAAHAVAVPDAWVVYTGHNDLGNARFQQRYGTVAAGLAARTQAVLERSRLYVTLSRALGPRGDRRGTAIDPITQNALTPAQVDAALRHLEANLTWLAWETDRVGADLVLVVPTCDLLFPPPPVPCAGAPCTTDDFEAALALRDADPAEAVRLLVRARDHDRLVLRAPSSVGAALQGLAAAWPHVRVVDAERDLPREPGLDIPARHLFTDGLHLSVEGHAAIAALIAPALAP